MAKMDDTTKLLHKDFQVLILQNKETNAHLKKLNKPSTLPQSTNENLGEILAGVAVGAMDRKAEDAIAKGHNLGLGVTSKNGIDIVPGSEPKSPNAKETLFGITRAFYAKHSVQTLVDSLGKVNETLIKQEIKEKKTQSIFFANKTRLGKLVDFLKSDSGDGFFGSLADKLGITTFRKFAAKLFSAKERKKLYKSFGGFVGLKIKGIGMFILGGLKNLGMTLLKPLGSIVKGIIGLPKKILGFFGGVFSLIGRLALLGGGLFALSRLSEFLRAVSPEGRKKFVDKMVIGTQMLLASVAFLKDMIMDTIIPVLISFGDAIYKVIEFLARFVPGINVGQGAGIDAEQRIREKYKGPVENPDMPPGVFLDEKGKEAFIQNEIRRDRNKRFKKGLGEYLTTYYIGNDTISKAIGGKTAKEYIDEYRKKFKFEETKGLMIGNEVVLGTNSKVSNSIEKYQKMLEKVRKEEGRNNQSLDLSNNPYFTNNYVDNSISNPIKNISYGADAPNFNND